MPHLAWFPLVVRLATSRGFCLALLVLIPAGGCTDSARTAGSEAKAPHAWAPTTRPASGATLPQAVRDACDLVAEMAVGGPGVSIDRTTGSFEDDIERRPRSGCMVHLGGSFAALGASPNPFDHFREDLSRRGWQEEPHLSADGPDGTRYALIRGDVICFFSGSWDGGDDSDPSYRPDDRFEGYGRCAPLEPTPR